MGEVIQFPVKTKTLNERIAKITEPIRAITEAFEKKTYDLVFFMTEAPNVKEIAWAIKTLESRVIVVSMDKMSLQERVVAYRYPVCHVIVMSHRIARKDREYLEKIAEVNRVLLIRREKDKKQISITKYHTKKDYEDWKKNKK